MTSSTKLQAAIASGAAGLEPVASGVWKAETGKIFAIVVKDAVLPPAWLSAVFGIGAQRRDHGYGENAIAVFEVPSAKRSEILATLPLLKAGKRPEPRLRTKPRYGLEEFSDAEWEEVGVTS